MSAATHRSVEREWFGDLTDGRAVDAITLANACGMQMRVITYGGIIVSLCVPDRNGKAEDVTLGFDSLDEYVRDSRFFGALIGRYANRIAKGRFSIGDHEYCLPTNEPPNHLHGGSRGFCHVVWRAEPFSCDGGAGLRLTHTSPDGDQGYPGTLDARVTYTLTDDNALQVDYAAITDQRTPVNLTQHSYFNLSGHDRGDILGHELTLNASRFTPVDATRIPTGELRSVAGTPFDFRQPCAIGARIGDDDEQLRIGGGYDHNFVLDRTPGETADTGEGDSPALAARVYEPMFGRLLEVFTTEPGIQLYSGNGIDDRVVGKQWRVYGPHSGVALETQHFPDSPNHPEFPSAILEPGKEYRSRTIYRFSTRMEDRHE